MNAQQNFSILFGTVDKKSFTLGYAAAWIDTERFSKELIMDPTLAVKSWLKGLSGIHETLRFFGFNTKTYEELLPFVPEEKMTEIMKLELQVLEEEVREGGNPYKLQKVLTRKIVSTGKVIKTLLEDKAEDLVKSLLVFESEGVGLTAEMTAATVTQGTTVRAVEDEGQDYPVKDQEPEPVPVKKEPSVPKKSKEQEELDRLAFLWITGQYY